MGEVREQFGAIHVLVNNGEISGVDKPTYEITAEEWERVMEVNVQSVFLCTERAIPLRVPAMCPMSVTA